MKALLLKCPSCNGDLAVSKLHCHPCDITIEGDFSLPPLLRLNRAQLDFVEVFLKNRGNIREVERELGMSYPTVRARLDEVIDAIGLNRVPAPLEDGSAANRREILEQLSAGKLTPEDAARALGSASKPAVRGKEKSEREEPDHG